jgi:hypothetical protein
MDEAIPDLGVLKTRLAPIGSRIESAQQAATQAAAAARILAANQWRL